MLLVRLQVATEQLSVAETDAVGEGLIRPQIALEAEQARADPQPAERISALLTSQTLQIPPTRRAA